LGQVDSTFVQQRQSVGGGLGVDLTGIALQRCHTGRCRGIDAVVLTAITAGVFPDPPSRRRRNIEDDLAARQQPQRQMVPETVGVLDCPRPFGARIRPDNKPLVFGDGAADY
jgi:hypothetical protein